MQVPFYTAVRGSLHSSHTRALCGEKKKLASDSSLNLKSEDYRHSLASSFHCHFLSIAASFFSHNLYLNKAAQVSLWAVK